MMEKTNKGISEAASEKRKRGRPRVIGQEADRIAGFVAPHVKTDRGRQEVFYRCKALNLLLKDKRFRWLANEMKMKAGTGDSKPAILSELGRIPDEEDLKTIALQICELKPKTKEAVGMIRRFRLGRESPSDPLKLFHHLAAAVDAYREKHPSASIDFMAGGLRDMANFIEDDE